MKPKKLCLICVSVLLIISGFLITLLAPIVLAHVIRTQFVLTPESKLAQSWERVSSMMPMDFYFFNWTNPQDIYNRSVKPRFEQVGPYRFMMDLRKTNVTWNENGTVTYKQQKFWHFSEKGTNGSLQDRVTTLNTPALGAAHVARNWNYIVRKGLSFSLSSISVTHTVDELLFTGYPDALTKMAGTLPFFADKNIPKWDRFGWFYMRNGSSDFEGILNMETGTNSPFGTLNSWNYWTKTRYFDGNCGKVEGSSGDRFDASGNTIKMFFSELCRFLELEYVGETEVDGIVGKKYVLGGRALDNGTKYPSNKCFCTGDCMPSGVFNASSCQFGSPTFMSLPHFYNADPYYTSLVEGLGPRQDKHEFCMVLEPKTGVPLLANAKLQVNFLLHSVDAISLYEDVPTVFVPIIWFDQRATIPKKQLPMFKLLLNVPTIMTSIGGVLMVTGIVLLVVLNFYVIKKKKKKTTINQPEVSPLNPQEKCGLVSKKQLTS